MKYTIYVSVQNGGRGLTSAGHANNRRRLEEAQKLGQYIEKESVISMFASNGIYSGTDFYFEGDVSKTLITMGASPDNIQVRTVDMDILNRSKRRIIYDMQRTGKLTDKAMMQLDMLFSKSVVWLYRWFYYLTDENEEILSSFEVRDGFSCYKANEYIVDLKRLHWNKWVMKNCNELMYVLKEVYNY